MKGGSP